MPLLDVIVINYNGKGLTTSALKALEGQTLDDFKVIVVDNGSSDGSLQDIQAFLEGSRISDKTKLVPLDTNTGFAGGVLQGMKAAEGEYVALLNNDAEPEKDWLEELTRGMKSDPAVGICASKLVVHGTDVIDSAGDGYSTALKGFKRGEGEGASSYETTEYVHGACAGAALYHRQMIDEIGFLDESFFVIHEDTDLNLRAHLFGWKVLYVATAVVHHKVRSTIGHMSTATVYYTLRNSEFVRVKNLPLSLILRHLPELLIGSVTEFVYFGIRHRHPLLYLKAKLDAVRMLPEMMRKRRANMRAMRVRPRELDQLTTHVLEWKFLKQKLRKLIFE